MAVEKSPKISKKCSYLANLSNRADPPSNVAPVYWPRLVFISLRFFSSCSFNASVAIFATSAADILTGSGAGSDAGSGSCVGASFSLVLLFFFFFFLSATSGSEF